jgi:hypothetical protein
MRKRSVLGRPGSDLLFQALRLSTIGAEDFDGYEHRQMGNEIAMALPRGTTGSLCPTFVSARLVSLAVRQAYAIS